MESIEKSVNWIHSKSELFVLQNEDGTPLNIFVMIPASFMFISEVRNESICLTWSLAII